MSVSQATFAAGCFWGVEALFQSMKGVLKTEVGYTGGHLPDATHEQVCSGETGHAEAVRVTYDPTLIAYDDLLTAFWQGHDPTTLNRQGPDVGTQYRSAIFTHDAGQEEAARASLLALAACGRFSGPIVTQIEPASAFYLAEDYHQQYLAKRGMHSCH